MNIYQIIVNIIEKPNVPKFYREIKKYYFDNKLINESEAYDFLIQEKFGKNNENPNNNSDNCQES